MASRATAVVFLIVAYGALLRLDAITSTYGPVTSPGWLRAVQEWRTGPSLLRPDAVRWDPAPVFSHADGPPSRYRSDPYTYLRYAREMDSFYAAHRREPIFPYATKVWLRLLDGQDVAVSFASAAFSVLAIVLTYLLGATLFTPAVGLAAAFLLAIEYDAITYGIEGWRDDAFTSAVLLTALAMVRYMRDPTRAHALALGLIAGAACLIRITALSFIVPGFAVLAFAIGDRWNLRLPRLGIALAALSITVGPFLWNCWRTFGDPFYTINVHADVYREAEGQAARQESVSQYLAAHLRREPIATIDTVALGLTQYPFVNKWRGFDRWMPHAGRALSWLAIAGLFLFVASREGRLALVVLAGSLIPYAATWRVMADWRFTMHAYPFFLIAAAAAVIVPVHVVRRIGNAKPGERWQPSRRAVFAGVAIVLTAIAGWVLLWRVAPALVFAESIRLGDPATIRSGERDRPFFDDEWSEVVTSGTVTTRVARTSRGSLSLGLTRGPEYEGLARLDPSPVPMRPGEAAAPVHVLLNGRMIGMCDPASTPERIGVCRFVIPSDAVRDGSNKLTFAGARPIEGLRLWYLRIQKRGAA